MRRFARVVGVRPRTLVPVHAPRFSVHSFSFVFRARLLSGHCRRIHSRLATVIVLRQILPQGKVISHTARDKADARDSRRVAFRERLSCRPWLKIVEYHRCDTARRFFDCSLELASASIQSRSKWSRTIHAGVCFCQSICINFVVRSVRLLRLPLAPLDCTVDTHKNPPLLHKKPARTLDPTPSAFHPDGLFNLRSAARCGNPGRIKRARFFFVAAAVRRRTHWRSTNRWYALESTPVCSA